jgi:hypothetical protein
VRADPFSYALAPADASLWTVSSFDKVPDETVERFLSIAMQRNPSLGFRSCVIVNKRMYRLSQQAYFGTATFDREDLPYLAMLRRNHLQVRSVKYEADGLSFSFSHRSELAIVGLFDNLSCLEFLGALPSSLTVRIRFSATTRTRDRWRMPLGRPSHVGSTPAPQATLPRWYGHYGPAVRPDPMVLTPRSRGLLGGTTSAALRRCTYHSGRSSSTFSVTLAPCS